MVEIKRYSNYKQLSFLSSLGFGVKIDITENALLKMAGLIESFGGEVGWHGTVRKTAKKAFVIDDILVYPQDAGALHRHRARSLFNVAVWAR